MDKVIKTLSAGETLINEGDDSHTLYYVQSGELEAFKLTTDGEEVILGTINEKEFVGEMSFFKEEPRIASVRAKSDCELVEFPYETFHKMLEALPEWNLNLINTLIARLKEVEKLIV